VKSLDGLYLTSFDPRRIRINKKVKEFYESLKTYHESKERNVEVYVPLVFAEQIPVAEEIRHDENPFIQNPFVDYQYVEAELLSQKTSASTF
jgi:hypothetical protein